MQFTLRFAALALLLAACSSKADTSQTDTGDGSAADATIDTSDLSDGTTDAVLDGSAEALAPCQPIVGSHCLAPWPSAYWETPAGTRTGWRIDLPDEVMPADTRGNRLPSTDWNRRDGFSPNTPIVVLPGVALDAALLPDETRPALDFAANLPILLADAQTGAFVPYFAELDSNATPGETPALIIRPWTPLREQQRLVVGLTTALRSTAGESLRTTPAMAALLRNEPTGDPRIDAHLTDWQRDLTTLTDLGVDRSAIVAAWHFDTASQVWTEGPGIVMREAFRSFAGDGAPPFTITQVELATETAALFPALPTPAADARITYKPMHPEVALRIRGTFTAPLFLTSADAAGRLNWNDAAGTLDPNGTVERPFLLLVPPSALTATTPPPTLIYGHGLLRSACDEGCVEPGAAELMPHLTALLGTVTVATDWWGLSQADLPVALSAGANLALLPRITDKLAAGAMMPFLAGRIARLGIPQHPWFARADGRAFADTTTPPRYYGNSLGGIMGTTMVALNPEVERAVLNVPGGGWSMLLNRSSNFAAFLTLINRNYPDRAEQQLIFAMSQSHWDLSDPLTFADRLITEPLAGAPANRRALWSVSLGDAQVPTLSAGYLARVAGQPLLGPVSEPWPLVPTLNTLPYAGSAFLQWDALRGNWPAGNGLRSPDNDAHYATRWMPAFQQMTYRFLLGDGAIEPRYCLATDTDGALPCTLTQTIPDTFTDQPAAPQLPPPPVD
jgi:hypothetical protein